MSEAQKDHIKEDFADYLARLDPRQRWVVEQLLRTGLRPGECVILYAGELDERS